MNESWTQADKKLARKLFNKALSDELDQFIIETREKAVQIQNPEDLYELENFIRFRRKEIDLKYDYRYSVLLRVFSRLLGENRIDENEIHGFSDPIKQRILLGAELWKDQDDD